MTGLKDVPTKTESHVVEALHYVLLSVDQGNYVPSCLISSVDQ